MIGYSLALRLGLRLARLFAPWAPKLRAGLEGRRGLVERVRAATSRWETRPYWFHLASSGELEQALPILDRLKALEPRCRIFISYFSPTAKRALELETNRRGRAGLALCWDGADFGPVDLPEAVSSYLDALHPACLAVIHRELWPTLLSTCREREIPCYAFAMFLPRERPWRERHYARLLENFRFVGTAEDETALRLKRRLPSVRIEAAGDPRIERVLSRRSLQRESSWSEAFRGQKVLVCASLWDEDFDALSPALESVLERHPDWRLVIVPHEPDAERLEAWRRWFSDRGRPLALWSEWLAQPTPEPCLIVDGVGFLAELYRVARLVFVGGSFKGKVHNVLEPAAYGCPVLTGPFLQNSAEATELSAKNLGVIRCETPHALRSEMDRLMSDPPRLADYGTTLRAYLARRAGAAARYAAVLLSEVPALSPAEASS